MTTKAKTGMASIRECYGVPAKRGMQVTFLGDLVNFGPIDCLIVGSTCGNSLKVRIKEDGGWSKNTFTMYPSWKAKYPESE